MNKRCNYKNNFTPLNKWYLSTDNLMIDFIDLYFSDHKYNKIDWVGYVPYVTYKISGYYMKLSDIVFFMKHKFTLTQIIRYYEWAKEQEYLNKEVIMSLNNYSKVFLKKGYYEL